MEWELFPSSIKVELFYFHLGCPPLGTLLHFRILLPSFKLGYLKMEEYYVQQHPK